ncbi:hypothetical protein LguiA_024580 [Lonicera macranthoides]
MWIYPLPPHQQSPILSTLPNFIAPLTTARRMYTCFARRCVPMGWQMQREPISLWFSFPMKRNRHIPLWHQKASQRADGITLWDYHVICVQRRKEGNNTSHLVWDLDSSLPFPSPLSYYVAETIRPSFQLFSEFQRVFRIVHTPIFLRSFASDRRHMKDSEGNWTYEPPPHEPLVAEDGSVHNLNEYIEISTKDVAKSVGPDLVDEVFTQKLGVLVSESQLEEFFSLLIT